MKRRILSALLALALVLGMIPLTAGAADSAEIVSASMTLKSVLNVEFKAELKGDNATSYTVRYKIGDETQWRQTSRSTSPDDNGRYIFTAKLPAHRMHEVLHVELLKKGETIQSKDWTVQGYVDSLHNNFSDDVLMMELVDDMSVYGHYAAYYTGRENTDPDAATVKAVEVGDLEAYKHSFVTKNATYGASAYLLIDDSCDLLFRFNASAMAGKTLYIDGVETETTAVGEKVEAKKESILPQDWGKAVNVVVKNGEAVELEMNYSVLSYARLALKNSSMDAKLQNLLKAMYLYSTAAKTYADGGQWITLADNPFKEEGTAITDNIADGYTKTTQLTKQWAANGYPFADIDLSSYLKVKFSVYSLAYHAISLNGEVLNAHSGKVWREIQLVKNGANWDYYYADEPVETITLPNNKLSDLVFMTGGEPTYYFSEVQALAPAYITVMEQPFALAGTTDANTPADGYSYDTTLTVASYSYKNFADLDLTPYTELKFEVKAGTSQWYGIYYDGKVIGETDNGGQWLEIRLVRGTSGWDVYYGGTKKSTISFANNNLSDMQFKFAANTTMSVTELKAVKDPAYTNPYTFICSDPVVLNGTPAENEFYTNYTTYTNITASHGNQSFIDLDLTNYTAVKFAIKSTGYHAVVANGSALSENNGGGNWREITIKKVDAGWEVFYGGISQGTYTLANNNLNDLQFKLGTATFCLTELKGIPVDGYKNPWVNVVLNPLTTAATTSTGRNLPNSDVEQVNHYEFTWNGKYDKFFAENIRLSDYTALKFYYMMDGESKYYIQMRNQANTDDCYSGNPAYWTEVLFEEQADGTWTLYADGAPKATGLTGTYLTDLVPGLQIGCNIYMTNLVGIPYVSEYVNVADNFINNTPDSTTAADLPSKDVSIVNVTSFAPGSTPGVVDDIVMAKYTELKFYYKVADTNKWFEMYKADNSAIYQGNATDWTEVKLVWENNTCWTVYVNGEWKNSNHNGETLKDIVARLVLGGNVTANVYVTNLIGKENPNYKYVSDYVNVADTPFVFAPTDTTDWGLPNEDVTVNNAYTTSWNQEGLVSGVRLADYTELKFYFKSLDGNAWLVLKNGETTYVSTNSQQWLEVKLALQDNYTWTLYENGTVKAENLRGTYLTDIIPVAELGLDSNVTNLIGIKSNYVSPYVQVVENLFDGSGITPTEVTNDIPSADVNKVYTVHSEWNQYNLTANVDMMRYTELKFYYKVAHNPDTKWFILPQPGTSDLYQGTATQWMEVKLALENNSWTIYVDGAVIKSGIQELKLTDIIPSIQLGGGEGDVYLTDLVGIVNPNYDDSYWTLEDIPFDVTATASNEAAPEGYSSVNTVSPGWVSGGSAMKNLDLTPYLEVRFKVKSAVLNTWFGYVMNNNVGETNSADWVEFKLVRNDDGWEVFVGGASKDTLTLANNNLSDMHFQFGNSGNNVVAYYTTELQGKYNPYYISPYTNVSDNVLTLTPTETITEGMPSLDVDKVNRYESSGWTQNILLTEGVNLSDYTELKFYYKAVNRNLELYSNSTQLTSGENKQWTEIKLVKQTDGTWTFYENDAKEKTGLTGTTLNDIITNVTFGGNVQGNFYITNLVGIEAIKLPIFEAGTSDYTIVYDSDSSYAAQEFGTYFNEGTGVTLGSSVYSSVGKIGEHSIVIGIQPAQDAGLSFDKLTGPSDYIITTVGEKIFIYGETQQGVNNGVYAFLNEHFALNIFYKDVHSINRVTDDIILEPFTNAVEANFDYMFAGYGEIRADKGDANYASSMGFVTDYLVSNGSGHNALELISVEKYGATHPEWFYPNADANDNKHSKQLYLAAENFATGEGTLVTTVANELYAVIQSQPNKDIFGFSPMDIDIWPTGTNYANSDTLKGTYGTNAAEYIIFMNAVAKELENKLGDRQIKLQLLAYNKTLVAPDLTGLTDEEKAAIMLYKGSNIQVVPFIAPVEANFHMAFTDSRNTVKNPATGVIDTNSKTVAQVIEGWNALGDELHLWWYGLDAESYFMVMDTYTNMGANYWFAYNHGVKLMYVQAQYNTPVSTDWARMKMYLQSALAKNVHTFNSAAEANTFVSQQIDAFMSAYFGAGAEQMKELLNAQKTWYQNLLGNEEYGEYLGTLRGSSFYTAGTGNRWQWTEDGSKTWSNWTSSGAMKNITNWMSCITAAKAAIDNDSSLTDAQKTELRKRVDIESLTIRMVFIKVFENTTYDSSLTDFYQAAKDLGITHSAEGTPIN